MTDPDKDKDGDDDLDLDLELVEDEGSGADDSTPAVAPAESTSSGESDDAVTLEPAEAAAVAAAGAADPTQGRWVWQFGAPPPPPSFGSRFFGGAALGELYRFFFCGVMVVVGALLPWGVEVDAPAPAETEQAAAESTDAAADGAAAAADAVAEVVGTHVPGYELVAGAFALLLGLYLVYGACVGIYSGRQKILPIALMLIPAEASWKRFVEAWGSLGDAGFLDKLTEVFAVTGTGVMVTLLGSTVVVLQFLATIGKVMQKTPEEKEKAAKRAASRGKSKGKAKGKSGGDGDDDSKAKGGRKRRR